MANAVIERLQCERSEQIQFIDALLSKVDKDGRDLVEAEESNLTAARERLGQIDRQLAPLVEFEQLRASSTAQAAAALGRPSASGFTEVRGATGLGVAEPLPYRTAGEMLADQYRAVGDRTRNLAPDTRAAERVAMVQRAVAPQTTTETPGILPTPIIGPVLDLIDKRRPFITSIGARPLGSIKGKTFSRPKVTQHTTAGKQTAEKTELASRAMKIESVDFAKSTYGGTVNVSRQDIDWTDPGAWNILLGDLAAAYGLFVETSTVTDFATAVTQSVTVEADTLQAWATAIYSAAALAYQGSTLMPDTIWCSVDMWATMGALVDMGRLVLPPSGDGLTVGRQSPMDFSGNMFTVPRVVVPTLPAGTVIVGAKDMWEFYEDQIGLLTAVEPSILGVEVAYAGYAAWGAMEADAFVKIAQPVENP